ncbi:MurR/RpiR family transcriptional regulator [Nocardia sp. CNY236]|uniref:MurR/RpiR family transcriptional regulator n=1 Tax=Nocardia sp. CNY236 TaxID=1169152 RepID=UPI00048A8E2F|nr:MurR/RpiR family transcriptional regulator [Nocardia sp. CNY236]
MAAKETAVAPAPETYAELRSVLQARMDAFAPGQQRVAKVLLTDPEGAAFRTIAENARVAGVHQSSLVRFATGLGLSGYPALVKLCREHLAEQAQLVRRFEAAEQHSASTLFAAAVEHDQQNLARTYARIDPAEWDRAVTMLAEAPRVHIIGLRKCTGVAQTMAYLLHMVRPGVRHVAPSLGGLVDELRDLDSNDVFVAISIRRYTADTVRALRFARQRGLRAIALTDDAASPLAAAADVTFFVDTNGITIFRSLSAFLSLVQTLSTAVALQRGKHTRAELQQDEALLQAFDIYTA